MQTGVLAAAMAKTTHHQTRNLATRETSCLRKRTKLSLTVKMAPQPTTLAESSKISNVCIMSTKLGMFCGPARPMLTNVDRYAGSRTM